MWKKIIIKFYFYCTKIRALLRTSLMFLWELKNAIISQNLRELCDIKANTKNPHTVASWTSFADFQSVLSHQFFYYTLPERSRRHILTSHPVAWACRRHILTSHLGAWACRRHIISIALKSVHSIEHLWCSFGNSKTQSFQQLSVNFVILKQIQKIHTQWLRQAQSPIISLHGAWACRRHVLTSHLGAWACRRPFLFLPVISTPLNHRIIYYYSRCLSLLKAHSHF